jgi:uroporphyrinogen decarboxylase
MAQMTSLERVAAALAGEMVDRPPVSLWMHFPERDQTAEALADVTLEWQREFGFDFIKLMPPGDYATIDWGAESSYQGSPGGTRQTTKFPVNAIGDWASIKEVPIDRDRNREVIEAARLVNERLGGEVPVLQTVFSPLTIAMKLSDGKVIEHLRQDPAAVHEALHAITHVTRALTVATLDRGAYGIFFATQCASTDVMMPEEYTEFGVTYDIQVLEAATASRFTMVHIHGSNIMFDMLKTYPANALNWHDRRTPPTLAEGERSSGRCVIGGIHEKEIATMTPKQAAAQARDAVNALNGRHMMVGPGCVIPIATPASTVRTIVDAVRR